MLEAEEAKIRVHSPGRVIILLLECICFICEIQHLFLKCLYYAKKREGMPFL